MMNRVQQLVNLRLTLLRSSTGFTSHFMPRDIIILECTEAKAEGKPTSRYVTTRNKKSVLTPGRLEKVKFNHFLKRRTLHREVR